MRRQQSWKRRHGPALQGLQGAGEGWASGERSAGDPAEAILPRAGPDQFPDRPVLRPRHQQAGKRGPRGRTTTQPRAPVARVRGPPPGTDSCRVRLSPQGPEGPGSAGRCTRLCVPTHARHSHRWRSGAGGRRQLSHPDLRPPQAALCPPALLLNNHHGRTWQGRACTWLL